MATIINGIFGTLRGTIGNVVCSSWKGKPYIKSRPVRKKPFTRDQKIQQSKWGITVGFLRTMKGLIAVTYRDGRLKKMTAWNLATNHVLKTAIVGTFPDFAIDYSQVQISRGDLLSTPQPPAIVARGDLVQFNWRDETGMCSDLRADDRAILVVYCEALNQCIYTLEGAWRCDRAAILEVPGFTGRIVQTWLGFISADGKRVANSQYTGKLYIR